MSGDIRNLGQTGKAVFDSAVKLQKAGLIDDAQFRELTNDKVGPQDVAIGNAALDKIKADTPDAMNLMFSIPKMNNDVLSLQNRQLGQTMNDLQQAREQKKQPSVFDAIGGAVRDFAQQFWAGLNDPRTLAQNVLQNMK